MKAKHTFVLTSIVGAALVLGLAACLWPRVKEGVLTNFPPRDLTVRVWDARSGKPVMQLAQDSGAVSSVWFSPDGRQLVTKSQDGTARIWDARTGNLLTNLAKDSNVVSSPIVTPPRSSRVRVWDVQSGKPLPEFPKTSGVVTSAWFSPDGKQIITASQDGTTRVWKVEKPSPASGGSGAQQH